jgi:signal transduction histidine kinase
LTIGRPLAGAASLIVYGELREVSDSIAGIPVTRPSAGVSLAPFTTGVVVFDLRSLPIATARTLREIEPIAELPLVVVSDDSVDARVREALAYDELVSVADGVERLERRLPFLFAVAAQHTRSTMLARTRATHTRFEEILDGIDVGIVMTDAAGCTTFANRASRHLLVVDEPLGRSVVDLLALPRTPQALLAGSSRRLLSYMLTRGDIELDLDVTVCVHASGFYFVVRDVREEKMREDERRRFEHLAAMGTMVAGFAHEVRNPVAALRMLVEGMADEIHDTGDVTRHVSLMIRSIERIERLVRTSLQFGRPTAPKRSRHRPWVIVSSAMSEVAPRLQSLPGEVRLDVEDDLPDVNVDDKQMSQALVILLQNALDATGAADAVSIRVRQTKDRERLERKSDLPLPPGVVFEVIDDGPGIPTELLARIFDPFFTTKPSGTGLGLPIAQQIVNENGARLEVASTRAGHTVFAIIVPPDISRAPTGH